MLDPFPFWPGSMRYVVQVHLAGDAYDPKAPYRWLGDCSLKVLRETANSLGAAMCWYRIEAEDDGRVTGLEIASNGIVRQDASRAAVESILVGLRVPFVKRPDHRGIWCFLAPEEAIDARP